MINLLTAILLTLFTPKTQVLTVKQTNKLLDSSVLIRVKMYAVDKETLEVKRGMGGCSGTYISEHVVLTAAHCFEFPVINIWVRDINGVSNPALLAKLDPERDLALLIVTGKTHKFSKLAKAVRKGEGVYNVGNPLSFEFLVSEGIVAGINQVIKPFIGRYLVTTATINPGSSGGGAFNSEGELIGVNTMTVGMFGWTGITLAVDLETVRGFINVVH